MLTTSAETNPRAPLPPPSRTNWTRLVPPSVLTGHVSSADFEVWKSEYQNGDTETRRAMLVQLQATAQEDLQRPRAEGALGIAAPHVVANSEDEVICLSD